MSMIWAPLATSLPISPLFKIPFLFVNARCVHVAYTPPNPVPNANETKKYGYSHSMTWFNFVRGLAVAAKGIHWLYAVAESAVIIANRFPSEEGTHVLSTLLRRPSAATDVEFTPAWIAGCALLVTGAAIRLACQRELGRWFTWEMSVKKDQELITTGPYSVVRHPSYTGMIFITAGAILCQFGPGSWMRAAGWTELSGVKVGLLFWFGYTLTIPGMMIFRTVTEDRVLRESFPVQWDSYAKRTPYRLIPYVF
ncbi:hypothetical protein BDW22DRAFT_1364465 [Trametopsis cervina]|nr:hypothetical protein BDW22DRAFT_1364465 [Trametopsis cervina]